MRIMDEATMERVAQYNIEYQKEHGVSPSYRNIMHALHLGSLATVQRYLNALEKSGRIERTRIGTIDPLPQLHTGKTTATPLLGRIACGEPTTEVEHIEESFALPQDLFGTGKLFMLHAHGDSMIEAGIDDGDLLVIREQNYADDGEIIVALVNGDNILTFYARIKIVIFSISIKLLESISTDNIFCFRHINDFKDFTWLCGR